MLLTLVGMAIRPEIHIPRLRILAFVGVAFFAVFTVMASSLFLVSRQPAAVANSIDTVRNIVGDSAVAHVEGAVYDAKDWANQSLYAVGLNKPQAPWQSAAAGSTGGAAGGIFTDQLPGALHAGTIAVDLRDTVTASETLATVHTQLTTGKPQDLPAFGKTIGEGKWQLYIQNSTGVPVAFRTFLSPDPQRPYMNIGIVAFDLTQTRLGFVLGTDEPKSTVPMSRTGAIPAEDRLAGKLLAVFNGGWKARHGHYGVGVHQTTVLPPVNGVATIALQDDGSVRMGVWGTDVLTDGHTIAWRQNNAPLIHDGQINPRTSNMSIADWGSALNGNVAVWRSALGISRDGKTLYYAAGDGVLVSAMATALKTAGAVQAMQLDVNDYWVHFDAVRAVGGTLKPEALFDAMAKQDNERYLKPFTRDFFYVCEK